MNATPQPPLCRYCGKAIPKRTVALMCYAEPPRTEYLDHRSGQMRPIAVSRHRVGVFRTKAELQKVVNEEVVSVRKHPDGTINFASTWDGQSYVSEYFCNGKHATLFAYVMAKAGEATTSYAKAIAERIRA